MNINRRTVLKTAVVTPGLALMHGSVAEAATKIRVKSSVPGVTPFISNVTLSGVPLSSLQTIEFVVQPKKGSTTKGIGATYTHAYLNSKGLTRPATGEVTVPVFGLYASDAITRNVVSFTIKCKGVKSLLTYALTTIPWQDPTGSGYAAPTVVQARNNKVALGFSTYLLKAWILPGTPLIVDTDGEVRWVFPPDPAVTIWPTSGFFNNGVYIGSSDDLVRAELNGLTTHLTSYESEGYTNINEHNIDQGKFGMLIEAETATDVQSCIIEVNEKGKLLNSWNFSTIISSAMSAAGDDPTGFVVPKSDWFHLNSATYWKENNQIIASSRENFVIAVDYDSKKIKWILGDTSKSWFRYPSLRAFALTMTPGSTAPIGQHSVSINNNNLLLFDDGAASDFQSPAGISRDYSVIRKYSIDLKKMTATEIWNYNHTPEIYSAYTSSVYQVGSSYLIDYAFDPKGPQLVGLGKNNEVAFQYQYPGGSGIAWNAAPIDLSSLIFTA